jgi:hypothetical protein
MPTTSRGGGTGGQQPTVDTAKPGATPTTSGTETSSGTGTTSTGTTGGTGTAGGRGTSAGKGTSGGRGTSGGGNHGGGHEGGGHEGGGHEGGGHEGGGGHGGGGHGGGGHEGGGQSAELLALLDRIARAQELQSRPALTLNADQLRVVLHYSTLSNGLGNFGRHGDVIVGLLSPVTLSEDRTLTLPSVDRAATTALVDRLGIVIARIPFATSRVLTVEQARDVVTVEVEDQNGTPFRLGLVRRIFATSPQQISG